VDNRLLRPSPGGLPVGLLLAAGILLAVVSCSRDRPEEGDCSDLEEFHAQTRDRLFFRWPPTRSSQAPAYLWESVEDELGGFEYGGALIAVVDGQCLLLDTIGAGRELPRVTRSPVHPTRLWLEWFEPDGAWIVGVYDTAAGRRLAKAPARPEMGGRPPSTHCVWEGDGSRCCRWSAGTGVSDGVRLDAEGHRLDDDPCR